MVYTQRYQLPNLPSGVLTKAPLDRDGLTLRFLMFKYSSQPQIGIWHRFLNNRQWKTSSIVCCSIFKF
jgi:hypothetical protein